MAGPRPGSAAADRIRVAVAAAHPRSPRDDPAADGDGVIGTSGIAAVAALGARRADVVLTLWEGPPVDAAVAAPAALLRLLRADRRLPARRALESLARGAADAVVCFGDGALAMAAAVFVLGPLRGATQPSLAAVVPDRRSGTVWCDVTPGRWPTREQVLVDAALAVAAARTMGVADPEVGVLVAGDPPSAAPALATLLDDRTARPVRVSAGDTDVVLTDGVTSSALVEAGALGAPSPCRLVLGVPGVVVVGPADPTVDDVAAAVDLAVQCVQRRLVDHGRDALGELVAARRRAAGLAPDGDRLAGSGS